MAVRGYLSGVVRIRAFVNAVLEDTVDEDETAFAAANARHEALGNKTVAFGAFELGPSCNQLLGIPTLATARFKKNFPAFREAFANAINVHSIS